MAFFQVIFQDRFYICSNWIEGFESTTNIDLIRFACFNFNFRHSVKAAKPRRFGKFATLVKAWNLKMRIVVGSLHLGCYEFVQRITPPTNYDNNKSLPCFLRGKTSTIDFVFPVFPVSYASPDLGGSWNTQWYKAFMSPTTSPWKVANSKGVRFYSRFGK